MAVVPGIRELLAASGGTERYDDGSPDRQLADTALHRIAVFRHDTRQADLGEVPQPHRLGRCDRSVGVMRNFKLIATVEPAALLNAILRQPDLWKADTYLRDYPQGPFEDVETIFLRFPPSSV